MRPDAAETSNAGEGQGLAFAEVGNTKRWRHFTKDKAEEAGSLPKTASAAQSEPEAAPALPQPRLGWLRLFRPLGEAR